MANNNSFIYLPVGEIRSPGSATGAYIGQPRGQLDGPSAPHNQPGSLGGIQLVGLEGLEHPRWLHSWV